MIKGVEGGEFSISGSYLTAHFCHERTRGGFLFSIGLVALVADEDGSRDGAGLVSFGVKSLGVGSSLVVE